MMIGLSCMLKFSRFGCVDFQFRFPVLWVLLVPGKSTVRSLSTDDFQSHSGLYT